MTSVDEKSRDPELGAQAEAESPTVDVSPEKSKEAAKESKDGDEKENKGNIKDYFVGALLIPNPLSLTRTRESSNTVTDFRGYSTEYLFSAQWLLVPLSR